ncbi:MAG: hypothetical protein IBX71_04755 [Candidatus Desulforudis sp.]|nr:hypothetical protein [Desulforudis sp.]
MAGKVKDKYGENVAVDVIRPQDREDDGNPETPSAPNIAVDGKTLNKRVTLAELDRLVSRKLRV